MRIRGFCGAFLLMSSLSHADIEAPDPELAIAAAFIDAFYSFDAQRLKTALASGETSIPAIGYYQGWAAGGNYKVQVHHQCTRAGAEIVCSNTVKDDLMTALRIAFDVTDTFHLSFADGKISAVRTSSDDLDVYKSAEKWVWRERPELVSEACKDYFDGGPTPGLCVKAMVRGFAEYTATDEYRELAPAHLIAH